MKILVCGTRGANLTAQHRFDLADELKGNELIEGCCPESADELAEDIAKTLEIPVHHFPSHTGNYLQRNIEMVALADKVIAFWNGFSYGTAHTIAHAAKKGIPITIIEVRK